MTVRARSVRPAPRRTSASVASRSASTASGTIVSTRADILAWALCAPRSRSSDTRWRIVTANRSRGVEADPPSCAAAPTTAANAVRSSAPPTSSLSISSAHPSDGVDDAGPSIEPVTQRRRVFERGRRRRGRPSSARLGASTHDGGCGRGRRPTPRAPLGRWSIGDDESDRGCRRPASELVSGRRRFRGVTRRIRRASSTAAVIDATRTAVDTTGIDDHRRLRSSGAIDDEATVADFTERTNRRRVEVTVELLVPRPRRWPTLGARRRSDRRGRRRRSIGRAVGGPPRAASAVQPAGRATRVGAARRAGCWRGRWTTIRRGRCSSPAPARGTRRRTDLADDESIGSEPRARCGRDR